MSNQKKTINLYGFSQNASVYDFPEHQQAQQACAATSYEQTALTDDLTNELQAEPPQAYQDHGCLPLLILQQGEAKPEPKPESGPLSLGGAVPCS